MTMNARKRARLRNLCAIFETPLHTTDPAPELALHVLAGFFLVPAIEVKATRRKVLNDLRAPLGEVFEPYAPFVTRTAQVAISMQEHPTWHPDLQTPTDDLVAQHVGLWWASAILKGAGMGLAPGALGAAAGEYVKSRSPRGAVEKGARRAIGQGPLLEELGKTRVIGMTRAGAGMASLGVAATGTVAYFAAVERMKEIEAILMHRFQSGDLTNEQFRTVFGDRIEPDIIKRYWEM